MITTIGMLIFHILEISFVENNIQFSKILQSYLFLGVFYWQLFQFFKLIRKEFWKFHLHNLLENKATMTDHNLMDNKTTFIALSKLLLGVKNERHRCIGTTIEE
jgi:hypothetical protein